MTRRTREPAIERYHDETVAIGPGDVRYTIDLDDDEIEKLAAGYTPRRVTERAYAMLAWKREAAQDWGSYDPPNLSRVRRPLAEGQPAPVRARGARDESRDRDRE